MSFDPDSPDGIDTEQKAVPPYDGRKEAAEVAGQEESTKDGAKVGGASGLVEDDEMKAPDPADTERGATGTPPDEQPAHEGSETAGDDEGVGPAHTGGTGRAEDQA
jgi:hypothetical protein